MKISLEWLNQYLDRPADADEAEALLTAQGMPIDGRTQPAAGGDVVLDVEVTSNRSDCLSHVGIAREIAAGSGRTLKEPPVSPDIATPSETNPAIGSLTSVGNELTALCPLYTARVIRGVKIGPSPAWMVRRLEAVGLRAVNNVVDVTNYVLHELGQPLHAFDMAKLAERRIVVRAASNGETFDAIDGTKHKLSASTLVIADAQKAVAVAGVMGGLGSEVGPATSDILLESAVFDPLSVRRTSRALRLASDSSYRFERGVDPRGVDAAGRRAAALIVELAGGSPAAGAIRVGPEPAAPRVVPMRVERCTRLLGVELSPEKIVAILGRLGLSPRLDPMGKVVACTVPTFRLDLHREIDLIEEVARMNGIDAVPVRQKISIVARPMQDAVEACRRIGQTLVAHGYHETINFSFIAPRLGEPFAAAGETAVLIDDERRKSEPMLRPSLLPSLMSCRKYNQDVGNSNVRLYETAAVWSRNGSAIAERTRLGILADATDARNLSQAVRDLRGAIEEIAAMLAGESTLTFVPAAHPVYSAAADIRADGTLIGSLGAVSPDVQKLFDLAAPVVAAELDLAALLEMYPPRRAVKPLARFPGIDRDVSVVADEALPWDRIRAEVVAAAPALLEELRFLVTYRGKPIPAGKKSVSFRMTFRDPGATLRHEQVDGQVASVIDRLKSNLGAELRA